MSIENFKFFTSHGIILMENLEVIKFRSIKKPYLLDSTLSFLYKYV